MGQIVSGASQSVIANTGIVQPSRIHTDSVSGPNAEEDRCRTPDEECRLLPLSTLAVQLVAKIDLLRRDEAARFVRYRIPFKPKWPGRPLRLSKSASMPGLHSLERKA